jgi:hypothetical protein
MVSQISGGHTQSSVVDVARWARILIILTCTVQSRSSQTATQRGRRRDRRVRLCGVRSPGAMTPAACGILHLEMMGVLIELPRRRRAPESSLKTDTEATKVRQPSGDLAAAEWISHARAPDNVLHETCSRRADRQTARVLLLPSSSEQLVESYQVGKTNVRHSHEAAMEPYVRGPAGQMQLQLPRR